MGSLDLDINEASGVPFYRQIVDQVTQSVRSGTMPTGTRLPSVRELARDLFVSLITVRRAYADLETAGLIVRRQGQGTFVAQIDVSSSREQALNEARSVVQGAVDQAQRLGLKGRALSDLLHQLAAAQGGDDEK